MGFNYSWIVIEGLSRAEAAAALGLELGRELPGDDIPGLGAADLAGNRVLIVCEWTEALEDRFVNLTRGRSGMGCAELETVMYSEVCGYEDGSQTWRVIHDPESSQDLAHLHVEGSPPPPFEALRAEALSQQEAEGGQDAEVDYVFDIAPQLSKALCGFRVSAPYPPDLVFSELRGAGRQAASKPGKPSFLARLFGAR